MGNEIEKMPDRNGILRFDRRELFLILFVGLVGVGHIEGQLPDLGVEVEDPGGLVRLRSLKEGGPGPGFSLEPRPRQPRLFAGKEVGGGKKLGQVDGQADRAHETAVPPHLMDPHRGDDLFNALVDGGDRPVDAGFPFLDGVGRRSLFGNQHRLEHQEGAHGIGPHGEIKDEVVEVAQSPAVNDQRQKAPQIRRTGRNGGPSQRPVDGGNRQGRLDPKPSRNEGSTVVDDKDLRSRKCRRDGLFGKAGQRVGKRFVILHRRIQNPDGVLGKVTGKIFKKVCSMIFCQGPVAVEGKRSPKDVSAEQDGKGDVEPFWHTNGLGKIGARSQNNPRGKVLGLPLPVDGGVGDDCHALLEEVGDILSLVRERGQGAIEPQRPHRVDPKSGHSREKFEILGGKPEGIPEGLGSAILPRKGLGKRKKLLNRDILLIGLVLGPVDERGHPGIESVEERLLNLGIFESFGSIGRENDGHFLAGREGAGFGDQIIGPYDSPLGGEKEGPGRLEPPERTEPQGIHRKNRLVAIAGDNGGRPLGQGAQKSSVEKVHGAAIGVEGRDDVRHGRKEDLHGFDQGESELNHKTLDGPVEILGVASAGHRRNPEHGRLAPELVDGVDLPVVAED